MLSVGAQELVSCVLLLVYYCINDTRCFCLSFTPNIMTKEVTMVICETDSGLVLGQFHKVMAVKDTPELREKCNLWLDSYLRGVTCGKNITLQISCVDFHVPIQTELF